MSNNNEFDSMSPTVRAVYSALGGKAPTQAAVQEAPVETTVNEQVDESVTDDVIVVDIFEENGEIPFNESSSKEFFIENIGKVPFEFNINLSTVSRPGIIECSHMTGKVIAGERFKVIVKFFPGVPDNINEMLLVECGHFPAVRFKLKAVGIYPGLLLSLPRV